MDRLPGFKRRLQWFLDNRPDFARHVATDLDGRRATRRLLSLVRRDRLRAVCSRTCSTRASSSRRLRHPRALARPHATTRTCSTSMGVEHRVDYEPAESATGLFGGNSNWRGPIWFPVNYLHHRVAAEVPPLSSATPSQVECPTGSGQTLDALGGRRRALAPPDPHLPARRRAAGAPSSAAPRRSRPIRTGATTCSSTSTSTATTAPASAPATRPAGRAWSRS